MNRLIPIVIFASLATSAAIAQNYTITPSTLDCGGGTTTGGTYLLSGTIGQPDAGVVTGGTYVLLGGFWPPIGVEPPCPGDADGNGTIDLTDLALVLSDFGKSGQSLSGDVDNDGDVDLTDLALVLGEFGKSC